MEVMNKIKMKEEYRNDDDIINLILVLELHHLNLPKPFVHGKKCSNCEHRMHCKTVRCPKCHIEMRKRKREPRQDKKEEEAKKEKEEEERKKTCTCSGSCARDLTELNGQSHPLRCGHTYCFDCMRNRVRRGFSTCCHCDKIDIPDYILLEYKSRLVES